MKNKNKKVITKFVTEFAALFKARQTIVLKQRVLEVCKELDILKAKVTYDYIRSSLKIETTQFILTFTLKMKLHPTLPDTCFSYIEKDIIKLTKIDDQHYRCIEKIYSLLAD